MFFFKRLLPLSVLALSFSWMQLLVAATLPQDEVDVLNQIAQTMGAYSWNFTADVCERSFDVSPVLATDPNRKVTCDCEFVNNTCHIVSIKFKYYSLPGALPPQLVQLPYLQEIDFAYNYLNGTVPHEWALIQLTYISLFGNRLTGNIPDQLGNITSLTYLDLESNQFSGEIPAVLGKLVNLTTLRLSSNRLTGNLPVELAELKNLTDFRISDNNLNGTIPEFIQNWKQIQRLELQGTGLVGPIPPSISGLEKLDQLRISDIKSTNQIFPELRNMTNIRRIILRNCSISGEIPEYIWGMNNLRILDLSFNKLIGELPNIQISGTLKFIFLTGNFLSGNIPESILRKGTNVDLSFNNFTQLSLVQPACEDRRDLSLNLFRSSSVKSNLSEVYPCRNDFVCDRYWHSFHVNCGGNDVKVNGTTFEGDAPVGGGVAKYYLNENSNWGFSSTGDFTDDDDEQNTYYIENSNSLQISALYSNARKASLSLTYFGYCLANGNYNVILHFAEVKFTEGETYGSLGRRKFDIYVQDKLIKKDFDIAAEASGVLIPVTLPYNATVTNNILEIRFNWAGKGTTAIPVGGVYGPLVSAISVVDHNFRHKKKDIAPIVVGLVLGLCLLIMTLGLLCWRYYFRTKSGKEGDCIKGANLQTISFTLEQIKAATNNFGLINKIGEGGFGPVYKGMLSDGTVIAVKQLSSKSRQGNREFLNELMMISCLQHPNLVKLHGCCIEGDQLLLVYEYLENNSLAHVLFGYDQCQLKLDWPTRQKICLGIAKGLAFLHEESRFKIVHRDIKATNILLDRDLNAKISDFGLAKLDEEENTHISTRVAGTIGYMAPEYALWGYLTYKVDVYSFGVVALEIVTGKNNMSYVPDEDCSCPLDWAFHLQQSGKLMELVDQKLGSEFNEVEAERMIRVALICTNASPSLRPTMSDVVNMLEGTFIIPEAVPSSGSHSEDLRFKTLRDHHKQINQDPTRSQAHYPASDISLFGSSCDDFCEINEESYLRFKAMRDSHKQTGSSKSVQDIYTI